MLEHDGCVDRLVLRIAGIHPQHGLHGRRAGLRYIYSRELERGAMLHTICPRCGALAVARDGYRLAASELRDGRCARCDHPVAGVGMGMGRRVSAEVR